LDQPAIARLSAPIGLNIGASSPWEVALSVVAEIVDASRGDTPRVGGPSRKPHVAA
jgi:xanthine dehydrogenase accessory factor